MLSSRRIMLILERYFKPFSVFLPIGSIKQRLFLLAQILKIPPKLSCKSLFSHIDKIWDQKLFKRCILRTYQFLRAFSRAYHGLQYLGDHTTRYLLRTGNKYFEGCNGCKGKIQ